ncbi:MAG: response regulator transcription factor [Hyphomicrobiales bacterium]|nr:MAG: response regulator transcription factor [Hyphomicrobiales bacterium]
MIRLKQDIAHAGYHIGDTALAGLASLIAEAERHCDDGRVTLLERILCDVEALVERAQEPHYDAVGGPPSLCSVHQYQVPFAAAGTGSRAIGSERSSSDPGRKNLDFDALTAREKEIIEHLARGAANKVIARELDLAEATVKVHIKSILRKLGLKNRTQAALCAIQQGWLRPAATL